MSVSIRQAFRNVFSEKYNKVNCGLLLLLSVILGLSTSSVIGFQESLFAMFFAFYLLLYLLLAFVIGLLGSHNAIFHYKDGVIPNIFNDYFKIVLTSIKHGVCGFFSFLLYVGIPAAIYGILLLLISKIADSMPVTIILSIIFIFLFVINIVYYQYIYFNVLLTLKCGSWFNLCKAYSLWKIISVNNRFAIWLLKIIALAILYFVLQLLFVLIYTLSYIIPSWAAYKGGVQYESGVVLHIAEFIAECCSDILDLIFILIVIDLNAQLISGAYPNLEEETDKQISNAEDNAENIENSENNVKQDSQET